MVKQHAIGIDHEEVDSGHVDGDCFEPTDMQEGPFILCCQRGRDSMLQLQQHYIIICSESVTMSIGTDSTYLGRRRI